MSDFGSIATAQMVVHDALCPANDYENLSPSLQAWKPDCQCDLLAKARADEKAKWTHVCPDNNCCHGSPE